MPQSLPRRNLIAMIRIQPTITRRAYFFTIFEVVMFTITGISCIALFIFLAIISFVTFKVTSNYIELLIGGWLVFVVIVWYVGRELYRAIRSLRGLHKLSSAISSETSTFSWNRFLKISLPSWLYAEEVLYDPSPTSILDRVQGSALTTEELRQRTEELIELRQGKSASSRSIRISLSYNVTISVSEQIGTLDSLPIVNEYWASIIALLATRRGWVPRDEILRLVYGKAGYAQQARLTTDTSRINQEIQKLIKEPPLFQETYEVLKPISSQQVENEAKATENVNAPVDIFEHMKIGGVSCWRISLTCEIDECNTLVAVYRRIQEAQEGKASTTIPSREELRITCQLLMETIGRGFMASYQRAEAKGRRQSTTIWPWAAALYEVYRNQFLDVLEYAAQQEVAIVKKSTNREEKGNAREQAAQFFRWMVIVSIGVIPDRIKAEEALAKCLQLYKRIHDVYQAESIVNQFQQRMREIDAGWKINPKISKIWPEVVGEESEAQ